MALRLLTGSQNTRRIKRDSNAKFTAPPHQRGTVMAEQVGKGNNRKLGQAYKTAYE
jgi:arginine/lysine/ornithine decarboxylase